MGEKQKHEQHLYLQSRRQLMEKRTLIKWLPGLRIHIFREKEKNNNFIYKLKITIDRDTLTKYLPHRIMF